MQGSPERVLVDPNSVAGVVNPDYIAVSPSGRFVAYALSKAGRIPATLHVCDVETGRELDHSACVTAVPMFAWLPDESGFFYSLFRRLFDADGSGDARVDGLYSTRSALTGLPIAASFPLQRIPCRWSTPSCPG